MLMDTRAWGCQKCEQSCGETRIQRFSGSVKSVEFREERGAYF